MLRRKKHIRVGTLHKAHGLRSGMMADVDAVDCGGNEEPGDYLP